jgi:K+-transporting ATPase ATPase A chain
MLYALLRLQSGLSLNPQHLAEVSPDLALNTAINFVTNTSWQSYGGETTLSYASQMAGITVQSFLSVAAGMAVAIALIRGFARRRSATIGNFWVDRHAGHALCPMLPICDRGRLGSVAAQWRAADPGAFSGGGHFLRAASRLSRAVPVATQEAIKLLSGDGGGFFNANSAHPFENPTPADATSRRWCSYSR